MTYILYSVHGKHQSHTPVQAQARSKPYPAMTLVYNLQVYVQVHCKFEVPTLQATRIVACYC